jgi:Holliday junction resolvasome RuvABC endonuclease subunit
MRYSSAKNQRVLAIDPYTQGFGFAVLEGPKGLIDYGIKKVRGNKNSACLRKLANLIECYQPAVIVLENTTGRGSRRCLRVQELTQEILRLAFNKRIKAQRFSRVQIGNAFSLSGAFTKHQIASSIAKELPELALRLPPARKLWMHEDERMTIFDAVALAWTFFLRKPN